MAPTASASAPTAMSRIGSRVAFRTAKPRAIGTTRPRVMAMRFGSAKMPSQRAR